MGVLLKRYDPMCATGGKTIVTSDTTDQDPDYAFRGFHCGAAGDVAVITLEGKTQVYPACAAGSYYPYAAQRFLTTGTTCTSIVGVY